jgi:hypothetical protein
MPSIRFDTKMELFDRAQKMSSETRSDRGAWVSLSSGRTFVPSLQAIALFGRSVARARQCPVTGDFEEENGGVQNGPRMLLRPASAGLPSDRPASLRGYSVAGCGQQCSINDADEGIEVFIKESFEHQEPARLPEPSLRSTATVSCKQIERRLCSSADRGGLVEITSVMTSIVSG